MFQQLYNKICEKQLDAFQQLGSNLNALEQQAQREEAEDNSKITEKKDSYSSRDKNNESVTQNRSVDQSQIYSRGSPINGFKYKSDDNQQQFQQKLPCPKRLKEPDNISEKNIIDLKKETIKYSNGSKANQYSMMTNMEENPEHYEQIGHLRHVCDACSQKPKKRTSKSQNKNQYNKVEYSNRSKNHRNYLPIVKNSVKTQNLLTNEHQQSKGMSYMNKQFSSKNEKKKKVNIKLNSNVVSYCQSLQQSSVEAMAKMNGSFQQNNSKQLKKPGYIRLKNLRYKTQENAEKIKKEIQNEQEEFRQKQKEIKLQLKVFYQKKKKIKEKLKKLNMEMAQFNSPKLLSSESSNLKNSYLTQKRSQRQLYAGQIIRIGELRAKNIKEEKHQKQLENSRKAIEFVEKMSKQSLRRRIQHQKKIKKDIYNRVKQHACINCSRVRCHIEVLEGQTKKQTEVIPTNKSRIK